MAAASDGVHSSIKAIQDMEAALARFSRAVVDQLPEVERELRQITEQLEDRRSSLRCEIASLESTIASAEEDDDTSYEQRRLGDAEDELTSTARQLRRLEGASAAYVKQARSIENLATAHSVKAKEFLSSATEDLKAFLKKQLDGFGGTANEKIIFHDSLSASQKPVSTAIQIDVEDQGSATNIRTALSAIDEVHQDGVLPVIPVRTLKEGSDEGRFWRKLNPQSGLVTADFIEIRSSGSWPSLTMLHETGHFLDLDAIGEKGEYATLNGDPDMNLVLEAAEKTNAIRFFRSELAETQNEKYIDTLNYMLKPKEIWARAYAQFVATRSGNEMLHHDLQNALLAGKQWHSEDFLPIAAEIERLFKKLNWI